MSGDRGSVSNPGVELRDLIRHEAQKATRKVDQVILGSVSDAGDGKSVGVLLDGFAAGELPATWANSFTAAVGQRVTVLSLKGGQSFFVVGVVDQLGTESFFNGTFFESFSTTVTESGGTVTLALEKSGGGDLTMQFSDGQTVLDTSPAQTIDLTVGSDNVPTTNFIYIPQSTKELTKSTSDFPSDEEHIRVAFILVPSASFISTYGAVAYQNWNDHAAGTDGQGHMAHMSERLRREPARWASGLSGAGADDYLTIAGTTVDLKIASGFVYQMHKHAVPAFDTSVGDVVLVKNWSGDAYHELTNLYDIVADSTGTTIGNNRYFNVVLWGVANETGTFSPTILNLPSGTYTSLFGAQNDVDGFDDLTIPREFLNDSSTGFLMARLTIQMKTTTWDYQSTTNLRGTNASVAVGGIAGAITDFPDSQFSVFNVADITKIMKLDASGIATGNVRTLIVPDDDGTIALESFVGSSIATHAAITTAHHSRYTDAEAAAKILADDDYVKIAGDVMAGALTVNSTITATGDIRIGDQVFFNYAAETNSYLQHSTGSNYFRFVQAGSEAFRFFHDGATTRLDLYGTSDSHIRKVEGGNFIIDHEVANGDIYVRTDNGGGMKNRVFIDGSANRLSFYNHDGTEGFRMVYRSMEISRPYGCDVYLNTTQSVATGTSYIAMSINAERYDEGADFSTSTDLFTCPVDGLYAFGASTRFQGTSAGNIQKVAVTHNSGAVYEGSWGYHASEIVSTFGIRWCSAGETLKPYLAQNSGSSKSTYSNANRFWAVRLT